MAGISLTPSRATRTVSDHLRGREFRYDVATGETSPDLVLPMGVRGAGLRRALLEYSAGSNQCFGDLGEITVSLFTSVLVTATGASDRIIFHANPQVCGYPWYDFVRVLAEDDGGKLDEHGVETTDGGGFAFWAGRMMAIMDVVDAVGGHHMLALLQQFGVKEGTTSRAGRDNKYIHDMSNPVMFQRPARDNVPFAIMEPCVWGSGEPYMWLVDTEAISRGLWAQRCFDNPGKYWFLRRGGEW